MEASGRGREAAKLHGSVVGIDPHKRTLSATVLDGRGGLIGTEHFKVSGKGHRALERWALGFGPAATWGVEGAGGIGRHTAAFRCMRGHDVRDVCPNRTNERARRRREGKSDALDSERIAREILAHRELPRAFKRAGSDAGPDEATELLSLWHKERRSVVKLRQQLLNEAETLLSELPDNVRDGLPTAKEVRPRLAAVCRRDRNRTYDPATSLRLRLLDGHAEAIARLEVREREAMRELKSLIETAGSSLGDLCGLSTRSAGELLVEVGDPRRFTEGGFARFNGTAPLAASSGEGEEEPIRHRLNRGGNRRVNAVLHRMAVTQLRYEPRAQKIYTDARAGGHTKREAMRTLKRNLSNVVHRRMMRDLKAGEFENSSSATAA
jgi:transposase